MTDVARLTRIRLEGSAPTEKELEDYLTSCQEDICSLYGRVWETRESMEIQTTKTGYWARVTLYRKGFVRGPNVMRHAT